MAKKRTVEQVVSATDVMSCVVATPQGNLYFVAHRKSELVHRVIALSEKGALHEFVHLYQKEATSNCHGLAYEFAYAVTMSLAQHGPIDNAVRGWKWCMADAPPIDSKHSWIECGSEAIDVVQSDVFSSAPGEPPRRSVVLVQPARKLWKQYQVTGVQSRTFVDFAKWLSSPDTYPLFSQHPEIDLEEHKQVYRRGVAAQFGGPR
jgi:hypothetical protein